MTLIQIQEHSEESGVFQAAISFDHRSEYHVTLRDPFSEQEEEQLEWYFEQYLRFPFVKQVQARAAADSITIYGETLFGQVFSDPKAYAVYMQRLQAGLNTLQFEIAGSPTFHRWHWEALKDPNFPQPLALSATMVRKNLIPPVVSAPIRPSSTINVLVVAARPLGKQDMGYRTISRPLVELLRQAGLPVQVEILRPGTYQALVTHLREVAAQHGIGYYHIIHFDVHGSVLTYEQVQKGQETNRYLCQGRYGRTDIQQYDGAKAFLFLEDAQDNKADPVEATELANELMKHQVPIIMLNACQSGKQVGSSETSLGSRLMQAGVQTVLTMGYSVTVSAAELLMKDLYQRIFAGDDLSLAIRHARQELYNRKGRRVYFNQTIDLEDWLLPVVYQNQAQRLTVQPFTPEERAAHFKRKAARYKPSEPNYGFVGRDLDILQIEKRLLTRRNIVLVRGMGGSGKTTLLHHLGSWWQTTGFVDQVFYFGYDERAWTRQQILVAIAQKLLDPVQYLRDFQPLSLDAQQALLTRRLRAEHHLLILDNLESITGAQLAIQHTLSSKEQAALHKFLSDLNGGRTLVLLGSRGGEAWLARETFTDNVYDLPGLDPEAASLLADRILERHSATKYRQDADFLQLLKLLDGFPLALEVVLANLAHQTPTDVLAALQAGDITMNVGDSEKRTENILRCIDYSHSNLSPEAQNMLICLAPFTSVIWQDMLDQYCAHLRQQPALAALPFERWPEVIREAQNWGLLSPDPDIPSFLRLQPVLPYFLRTRLHVPAQAELRTAVETAFREHYDELGAMFRHLLLSKESQERQVGQVLTGLEYENLVTALHLALAAQTSILNCYVPLSTYLDTTQEQRRGLELGKTVLSHLESYLQDKLTGQVGTEFAGIIDNIAARLLSLRQYREAEQSYQKALDLVTRIQDIDEEVRGTSKASIYHNLGMVAEEQRQWQQAEQYYQQALQIKVESNDRFALAKTYHNLGVMAQEQRQWQQAEQYYQQALQIKIEYNDRYSQASTYHQLGRVAEEQRQWQQAELYYQQTLQLFIEYNDRYAQAGTYLQLGGVAQQQRQWQQAELYYQQTLQLFIEYNDRYAQAGTYLQLGGVAQQQRQWQQAELYYQQALQLFIEYNDRYTQAKTYHNLGVIAQEQRRWKEAERHYQQALRMFNEYNDDYTQVGVYHQLGRVAQEQRHWEEAERHYQQALQIAIEYNDRYAQAKTYHQLGMVALELTHWSQGREYFLSALHIFAAHKDTYSISITLENLTKLQQASGDTDLPSTIAKILGSPLEEIEGRLREISGNALDVVSNSTF